MRFYHWILHALLLLMLGIIFLWIINIWDTLDKVDAQLIWAHAHIGNKDREISDIEKRVAKLEKFKPLPVPRNCAGSLSTMAGGGNPMSMSRSEMVFPGGVQPTRMDTYNNEALVKRQFDVSKEVMNNVPWKQKAVDHLRKQTSVQLMDYAVE